MGEKEQQKQDTTACDGKKLDCRDRIDYALIVANTAGMINGHPLL